MASTTTTPARDDLGYWKSAELRAALRISRYAQKELMDAGLPYVQPTPRLLRFPIAEVRAWLAETGRAAA